MMLAKNSGPEILKSKDYIFEPKVDGYRALCIKVNNKLKFISRNGNDITDDYPEFEFNKHIKAKTCAIDGEIVVFDKKGNASFQLIQHKSKTKSTAVFIAFDILEKNGKNLKDLPIETRKQILSDTVEEDSNLQLMPFTKSGPRLWSKVLKSKFEGVMAKRKESTYENARSYEWLKIKQQNTIDCVIIGITQEKREISSLALGLYDDNHVLKFIGKVGTGFSEKMLDNLSHLLKKTKQTKPEHFQFEAFSGEIPKNIITVIPNQVCEVTFQEVTDDFRLRIPVFKRLRDDKAPNECGIQQLTSNLTPMLTDYKKKRDFAKSPEPAPKVKKVKSRSLIYVIQKHYATRLHYDFRLEYNGVLLSWAIPKGLPEIHEKRLAIMVEDHPLSYAKFHGTIPKGNYGAGKVEIWDKGKYVNVTIKDDELLDLDAAIKKGHFTIYLKGKKLHGTYSLTRMKDNDWIMTKKEEENGSNDDHYKKESSKIPFTNLDKKLDGDIKKSDIIDYYKKIADHMLPHVENRAITLFRFPSGIDKGSKFFQKNAPDYYSEYLGLKKVKHEQRTIHYPVIKDKEGILYLANQVDEIHIMTSKVQKLTNPDKMIFDLDPTNLDLKILKATAKKLKSLIEGLGLTPFIMTTGGKGYHIVVPIKPELSNAKVREVALKIAQALVQSDPDGLTTELLKSKRKGKIFIDVNRNSPMQTGIAPYSIRARKGITIAAPFFWEDLSTVNPDSFNIKNYKLEDPWKDFYASAVSLKKVLKELD